MICNVFGCFLLSVFQNSFTVYCRYTVARRAMTSHQLCLVLHFYESRLLKNSTNKLSIWKVYSRQPVLLYKRLTNDIPTNTQSPNITNANYFYLWTPTIPNTNHLYICSPNITSTVTRCAIYVRTSHIHRRNDTYTYDWFKRIEHRLCWFVFSKCGTNYKGCFF